jgi:hypothetical protein
MANIKAYLNLFRVLPLKILFKLLLIKLTGKHFLSDLFKKNSKPEKYYLDRIDLRDSIIATAYLQPEFMEYDKKSILGIIKDYSFLEVAKQFADQTCKHEFDLLGSGKIKIDHAAIAAGVEGYSYQMCPGFAEAAKVKSKMAELLKLDTNEVKASSYELVAALEEYQPLDWHLDFKSGYRWDPNSYYTAVPIRPLPGVDVKVPWELSRFQHLNMLAWSGLVNQKARYVNEFILQVTDWIAANPVPFGVNWFCTMEVAIRAVNWILAWSLLKENPAITEPFRNLFYNSIYQHALHIESNLEYLLRGYHGNHYLSDIAGLIFIGTCFPEYKESDRWLAFGIQELIEESKHQLYDDGVSREGSTAYHCLVTEIFLVCTSIVLNLSVERRKILKSYDHLTHRVKPLLLSYKEQVYDLDRQEIFPSWYYEKLEKASEFIFDLSKSNGDIAQFGDNDNGCLYRSVFNLKNKGNEEGIVEADNGHKKILALAGKLFGRKEFLQVGEKYWTDAELFLGKIKFLPIKTESTKNNVLSIDLMINQNTIKYRREFALTSEIVIDIESRQNRFSEGKPKLFLYPNGGVAIVKNALYNLAIACMPGGLGGLGAHNHNDKLSFELNVSGYDIFVDGGSYLYTPLPELRNSFRSTWAHNTIVVRGKEQNDFIPGFLFTLPDRSNAMITEVTENSLTGMHNGYGFIHMRSFFWGDKQIVIVDKLEKQGLAYFILNLHPLVILNTNEKFIQFRSENVNVTLRGKNIKNTIIKDGFYSSRYGERIDSQRLLIPIT